MNNRLLGVLTGHARSVRFALWLAFIDAGLITNRIVQHTPQVLIG
jgi:hypothetical protein